MKFKSSRRRLSWPLQTGCTCPSSCVTTSLNSTESLIIDYDACRWIDPDLNCDLDRLRLRWRLLLQYKSRLLSKCANENYNNCLLEGALPQRIDAGHRHWIWIHRVDLQWFSHTFVCFTKQSGCFFPLRSCCCFRTDRLLTKNTSKQTFKISSSSNEHGRCNAAFNLLVGDRFNVHVG